MATRDTNGDPRRADLKDLAGLRIVVLGAGRIEYEVLCRVDLLHEHRAQRLVNDVVGGRLGAAE